MSKEECMAQVDDSLALAWKADQQQAEAELIQLIFHDSELAPILLRFGTNEEKAKKIYRSLSLYGAGHWVNDTFVAAAVLTTPSALEHMLQTLHAQPEQDSHKVWIEISANMVKRFGSEEGTNN